jgi:hypothetical protein
MKTLGRILIILAVFALVMGITYVVVNAGSSATAPQFDRPFPTNGDQPTFGDGQRPGFPNGERPELRDGERGEGGSFGWMFGAIKNIGIVAIIVALIVLPKGWMQKRRKVAQVAGE